MRRHSEPPCPWEAPTPCEPHRASSRTKCFDADQIGRSEYDRAQSRRYCSSNGTQCHRNALMARRRQWRATRMPVNGACSRITLLRLRTMTPRRKANRLRLFLISKFVGALAIGSRVVRGTRGPRNNRTKRRMGGLESKVAWTLPPGTLFARSGAAPRGRCGPHLFCSYSWFCDAKNHGSI